MIIVTRETFAETVEKLSSADILSVDTETTGLFPFNGDRLFSIQVSDQSEDYYFNYQDYFDDSPHVMFFPIKHLQPLFNNKLVFMQNAKFDMAFLYNEGIRFDKCKIHDTEVAGRIIRNDHLSYSLDEQSKRELGEPKDDAVMEWLKKNKCYTVVNIPGKDTPYKAFHFDKVPFELITKYGCKDTRLTYDLGMKQLSQLEAMAQETGPTISNVKDVYDMEMKLIHACFEMERNGIKIDVDYCKRAVVYEDSRIAKAEKDFLDITGVEITDSGLFLGPIFVQLGFMPGTTATGEFEVTDKFLEKVNHPLGEIIREYRDARKRANTYFKSFLHYVDSRGFIHPNMRQSGTATGRFSYRDPNLQNLPAEDNSEFPIRRAFIPPSGLSILSIDYRQVEMRMMLDEAAQHDLINKIKEGLDPHTATAELAGITRKAAKTLQFGLLYGMGISKLSVALGVSEEEARKFKAKYFSALPMVENFILQCSGAVKTRSALSPGNGWIKTWFGRRGYFNDVKWAYKAANFKIQGGSADLMKIAMINIDEYLNDKKSRMIATIHDELIFYIHEAEKSIIPELVNIMCNAYPHRFLPMDCSVEISEKSMGDLIDYIK